MYIQFELEAEECASCKKPMIRKDKQGLFPRYCLKNQDAQIKALGVAYRSDSMINDAHICEECASLGKASFTCCLCGKDYPSNEKEDSFGDPPEYLCKHCYSTVPAETWDKKVDELHNAHRWDFE